MRIILHNRSLYVLGAVVLIVIALWLLVSVTKSNNITYTTAVVERGDVLETVSVSGVVEAANTAELAFPIGGIVSSVAVKEGQAVVAGEVLIVLQQANLQAQRRDAVATLLSAQADRDELINGVRDETRAVTATEVAIAEENLTRTILEQAEKVKNAESALRSGPFEAFNASDDDEDTIAPTITGTYNCADDGIYTLEPFNSGNTLSYRILGLENGTYTGSTQQSAPLGDCGLRVQFSSNEEYSNTEWEIPIPNPSGANYNINLNALSLVTQQAQNAIAAAEQALDLALRQQTLENATPRDEALRRANATVMQAEAQLAAIDADVTDRTIMAPFSGIITTVDILPGETVTTAPVITLLADSNFELTARIPEIDITKIATGQEVEVFFDAKADELIYGTVGFISPLATEIDGVAYFEATVLFPEVPTWIRSGLNADIDIIIDKRIDALRVPRRFVTSTEDTGPYVTLRSSTDEGQITTLPITIEFEGNNGFMAITGLNEGTEVIVQ